MHNLINISFRQVAINERPVLAVGIYLNVLVTTALLGYNYIGCLGILGNGCLICCTYMYKISGTVGNPHLT